MTADFCHNESKQSRQIAGTALRLHEGVHALGLWLRRGGRCRGTQRQYDPRERTQLASSVDAYSNDQDKSV